MVKYLRLLLLGGLLTLGSCVLPEKSASKSPWANSRHHSKWAQPTPTAQSPTATQSPKSTPSWASHPTGYRHRVVRGDTLSSLARHYGLPLSLLKEINPLIIAEQLEIGSDVNLPGRPPIRAIQRK